VFSRQKTKTTTNHKTKHTSFVYIESRAE